MIATTSWEPGAGHGMHSRLEAWCICAVVSLSLLVELYKNVFALA
jgi:hypothetical protein